MRRLAILFAILVAIPAASPAQKMMHMYRALYSVSGSYVSGRTDVNLDLPGGGSVGSDLFSESILLATRNGYFVSRNAVVGFELDWEQGRSETTPQPNPANSRALQYDRQIFVGPLFRWYQPTSVRWFIFPEVSVGYCHFLGETEAGDITSPAQPQITTARGFGANLGLGVGYFLTRHVTVDASIRYSYRRLSGSVRQSGTTDIGVDLESSEIGMLLGFELLL